MFNSSKMLGAASVISLAILGAGPAYAAGTQAGSTITNNVTVNFKVGGVDQTASTASNDIVVDRKVNLTVAEVGSTTTSVSPGQLAAVTTFTVTNLSNQTLDFDLAAAQTATGGAGAHSNTDSFNATNVKIYVETDSVAGFSAGDTLISYIDELAADANATVYVVSDIPLSLATGAVAAVTLTATGLEGGTSGTRGAGLSQTTTANTAAMDTVYADGAGATDAARDAAFSAADDYTVSAAALSVIKSSKIIWDPVNLFANPKIIPGAQIEYCIAVSNAAGSVTATGVAISDTLPLTVTYLSSYGIFVNGSVDASNVCVADGTAGGSFSDPVVSGTLSDVSAGNTLTLRFRATIN